MTTERRRRGPVPRFSRGQLVEAALAVVEADGFDALSLRSVARHLGVGPMTLYTYVDSSDELAALVVERLVEETVHSVQWPRSWRGVLRLFAKELDALILAHPAMVEAYERGMVRSGRAGQIANEVLDRLMADGMSAPQARRAYLAVHSMVLGYALIRTGHEHEHLVATAPEAGSARPRRVSETLTNIPLAQIVEKLLDGFAP